MSAISRREVLSALAAAHAGDPNPLDDLVAGADWGLHDHGRVRVRSYRGPDVREVLLDGITVATTRYPPAGQAWRRDFFARPTTASERLAERTEREALRVVRRDAGRVYEAALAAVAEAIREHRPVTYAWGQEGGTVALDGGQYVSMCGACRRAGVPMPAQHEGVIVWIGGEWRDAEAGLCWDPPRVYRPGRVDREAVAS